MASVMDPGRLRDRVDLQAQGARTSDGGGGYTASWKNVLGATAIPAQVESLDGTEQLRAMQTHANASHRITIRHRPGVTAAMQFKLGTRVFKIVAPPVDVENRHRWLRCLVREEA